MHEHVIKTWVVDGDTVSVNGEEAGSSKVSGKALPREVVLGLHRAGQQDRRLGRLRGYASALRLRSLALAL